MKQMLVVFSLFVLFLACTKSENTDPLSGLTEMVRTQTQCADAWGYGVNNEQTITKLANYLAQKQITGSVITLQAAGEAMTCKACTCSSGFVFHVWADSRYISTLTAEGFSIK